MKKEHVCVCICTYKRPLLLARAIRHVQNQNTDELFDYSIIIIDNDSNETARCVISQQYKNIIYDVEPVQNIALARNRAVKNAFGDFIAFMDDDEFPCSRWLLNLYKTQKKYQKAGVLGPVKPHFDGTPPKWLISSGICERPNLTTGTILDSRFTRTGNALIKSAIFKNESNLFDPKFGRTGGEDTDFFRRVIALGNEFVWSSEAVVYEVVPPERWERNFYIKRAFLRGRANHLHDKILPLRQRAKVLIRSILTFALYSAVLPIFISLGDKVRMNFFDRYFHHAGRIMTACGIVLVSERIS